MNRGSRDAFILSAAAFVLLVVTTGEVLFRATSEAPMPDTVFLGIATNVPIHVGILYGAIRLHRSALPPQYSRRVIRWSLIGAVVAGLLIGMFAPFIFDAWFNRVATVRWGVSIGIGGGFLAGYLTARITEQRVLAERASVRTEEARERQELLEYLNALLRHEILNGTSAIQGWITILDAELDDPESTAKLERIQRQSTSMADIVTDVQVLLQASKGVDTAQKMDVTEIIESELQRLDDREEDIITESDLPPEAVVEANELLPRVFENLIRNAVEHNESTPIRVSVSATKRGGDLSIMITDNGPGIPEDLRADLFTPTVSRLDDESRLGTVIVGRLIEEYGGDIEVTETGTDGTTVTITLPLATTVPEETRDSSEQFRTPSA